jgi:hypothetical protein
VADIEGEPVGDTDPLTNPLRADALLPVGLEERLTLTLALGVTDGVEDILVVPLGLTVDDTDADEHVLEPIPLVVPVGALQRKGT